MVPMLSPHDRVDDLAGVLHALGGEMEIDHGGADVGMAEIFRSSTLLISFLGLPKLVAANLASP